MQSNPKKKEQHETPIFNGRSGNDENTNSLDGFPDFTPSRTESILKSVTRAAEFYLKEPDLSQNGIEMMLSLIGSAACVSRVYVFENHAGENGQELSSQKFEWTNEGISPQKNNSDTHNFSFEECGLSSWLAALKKGYAIKGHIMEMTEQQKRLFKPQEIISIALMPIFVNHTLWGFIGFDECKEKREWKESEIDALKTFSIFFGAMIERIKIEASHRQSIIQYQAVVEDQTELICRYLPDGSLTFANRAFCQFFERKREAAIGENIYNLLNSNNPTRWFEYSVLLHPLKNSDQTSRYFEHSIVNSNGETKWVRWMARPIVDKENVIVEFQSIGKDITEEIALKKISEYRLQQCIQSERLASLGEVVSGVAHEINNPNSFIVYNIPLLEETWNSIKPILKEYSQFHPNWKSQGMSIDETFQEVEEIIQSIKEGSDRITNVIENLREFSRFQSNLPPKVFNVNDAIEKTISIVGATVRKSVYDFKKELGENLPDVLGYISKIEQVIANIMVNAVKSIQNKKGSYLSIASKSVDRLNAVLIEISDSGHGMNKDVMERIFDPFFTTDQEAGKSGLGLAVSHHLVKENDGLIGILSLPGSGTKFTIYLPIAGKKLNHPTPTILCVNTDSSAMDMIKKHFYSVIDLSLEEIDDPSSSRIVNFMNNYPEIDFIISELGMQDEKGTKIVRQIKEHNPLIRVVLASDQPALDENKRERKDFPDAIIPKPIDLNNLVYTINKLGRCKL